MTITFDCPHATNAFRALTKLRDEGFEMSDGEMARRAASAHIGPRCHHGGPLPERMTSDRHPSPRDETWVGIGRLGLTL